MSQNLVKLNKEDLEAMMRRSVLSHSIEEIIEEPCSTRHMMAAASQSELPRDLKLLCMKRDYLLFDNTLDKDAPLSLRVIKTQYLDEVLTKILKEDEEQILRMVAVENAHFLLGIDLHSTEYYEKFVTYVQAVILDGNTSNWYIEMSDYIIDFLYDWFGKNKMEEVTKAIDRNALFAKKNEVDAYYVQLEKKQLEALEHNKKQKQSPYYPDPKELQSNLKRLVQIQDDEGIIMLANTDMTDEQISAAIYNEKYENTDYDYEEKINADAEAENLMFERVYADAVMV